MSAGLLPNGFHTIMPNIIFDDVEQAIVFLENAFGASWSDRITMMNGTITDCEFSLLDLQTRHID